jgi:capsular polysaccharide biosynthesis protein
MDLLSLLMILVRRWYVFLLVMAVTAYGLAYEYPRIKPDYQATGTLLLAPPNSQTQLVQQQPTQIPVNPLLVTNNGILSAAATVASTGNNDTERKLISDTYGLTYTIVVDSHAPVITVQGTAASSDAATNGVGALLAYLRDQLNALQQSLGAPSNQLVTAKVLYAPQVAVASSGSRNKTVLILGFVGLLVACALSFIVDGVVVSLRYRKFLKPARSRYPEPAGETMRSRPHATPVAGGAADGDGVEKVAQDSLTLR